MHHAKQLGQGKPLFEGLSILCNEQLQSLELLDNRLGLKSAQSITRVLQNNGCITELVLDYNELGDEGASVITLGLKWSESLEKLSLRYCNIGEDGGEAIGMEAVAKNRVLKELDLQGNPIGKRGVSAVATGLTTNTSLLKLNLADTNVSGELKPLQAIIEALKTNTTLQTLNFNLNTLHADGAKELLEALKEKKIQAVTTIYEKLDPTLFTELVQNMPSKKKEGKGKKKKGKKKKKKK